MDTTELLEPFERLLSEIAPLARVRDIERSGAGDDVWAALLESGFLDALIDEQHGGAGLSLADVGPLLQATGRHALPLPFGETLLARAWLAQAGVAAPEGPIVLLAPARSGAGYVQRAVPLARSAEYALVEAGDRAVLTELSTAALGEVTTHAALTAHVAWHDTPPALATVPLPACGLRALAAVARTAEIAGAADRLLDMTVDYAGQRVQFGKPIAKQQAIQQQLAVMGEQVIVARMAAQIACSRGFPPPQSVVAIAKQVASAAVTTIAATAHAVHGAIGISEEYDLQLYVRRLHDCRVADGSALYWAANLGAQRLASHDATSVDFVRRLMSVAS